MSRLPARSVAAGTDSADRTIADETWLYRLVVEASPDAILVVGGDGRITLVNSRTEELFGYSREDLVGKPFETLAAERSRASLKSLGAGPGGNTAPRVIGAGGDVFGLRRDKSELPIEIAVKPIQARKGDFVACVLDITARRKAEEYSELTRTIVEGARDYAIFMLDPAGFVLSWNEGAARIKGYSAEEIVGRHFSVFYTPDDLQAGRPAIALEIARVHGKYHEEGWRLHRDGHTFWASVTITALRNVDGSLRGFAKITRDITERKAAAGALRESERDLRRLADAMPQIVWTARPDGYVNYYNRRWYDFTGFPEGEGGDESWKPLLHPDDVQPCLDRWYACVVSGDPFELEFRFRDRARDTWRWHLCRALPFRDGPGKIVKWIGTSTDIDEEKRLREDLELRVKQRTLDLERSLQEKITLLKEVHHRVKNNLQIVCSLLSMQIECADGSPSLDPLRAAHHRVLAMSLIHELLYQSDTLSDLDFGGYIETLANQLFHGYCVDPDRIRLETEVEAFHLTVDQAIPCGLILNELVSNSLKHAFPGDRAGAIRIRFRKIRPAHAELTVADDGAGMPANFRFEEAQSLGLQVVRTLIAQLRGELRVTRDGGTAFTFVWALGNGAAPAPERAADPAHKTQARAGSRDAR